MRAFHTLRSCNGKLEHMKDFELMTLILSALTWRRYNGSIDLVTDVAGKHYVKSLGVDFIWDEIRIGLDIMDVCNLDENIFWAAGKLAALYMYEAPCVMIDLDFIVWKRLNFSRWHGDVVTIHDEPVNNVKYPTKEFFVFPDGAQWKDLMQQLNWECSALNTAFAYFQNDEFRRIYCQHSLSFMQNVEVNSMAPLRKMNYMIFAEQRLLPMLAEKYNFTIETISDEKSLLRDDQELFTHVWGYKGYLVNDLKAADAFCKDCVIRLKQDYYNEFKRLKKQLWFSKYC